MSFKMEKAAASAPGKVILFGEHFVVYDNPAIVSAINLRARVEVSTYDRRGVWLRDRKVVNHPAVRAAEYIIQNKGFSKGLNINIFSDIPPKVGLGSSASVSIASAAAASLIIQGRIDRELIAAAGFEGERIVHHNPSGIDTCIALNGGVGIYRRSKGFTKIHIPLETILIIDTGRMRNTGEMVKKVREYMENNRERFNEILVDAEELVNIVLDMFKNGDLEGVGKLMLRNQALLREVGVSSDEIEEAVRLALKSGAYGAKLTGAGGGGCVICLVDEDKIERVYLNISNRFKVYTVRLSAEGVKEEEI
ncbi:MAG: mevalonate kinase [Aigarchaeota archaeon]|nr:mevalonate kinase [Aigarchaeota archaeon]